MVIFASLCTANRWLLKILQISVISFSILLILIVCLLGQDSARKHYIRLVENYKKILDRNMQLLGGEPLCSHVYFRDKFINDGHFSAYDSCRWSNRKVNTSSCVRQRRIKKITILGDSNGMRFYLAVVRRVMKDIGKCKTIKKERLTSDNPHDKQYFCVKPQCKVKENGEENLVLLHTRGKSCRGCQSEISLCNYETPPSSPILLIEFLTSEYTMDTGLVSDFSHKSFPGACSEYKNACWPLRRSYNTQEYILKEYFADTVYPDLVLWFQNSHDKNYYTPGEIELAVHHLLGMMHYTRPKNTTFYVFNKVYEEVDKKPQTWKDRVYEGKYTLVEQLERLNEGVARGVHDFLTRKKNTNIYPFFDLYGFGKEHAKEWGDDGVHKKQPYYDAIIDYILHTFCDGDS